ncbi:hypothetical protein BT96DRAFT_875467 [Gymnopus androsaceus JB14]|uniref:Cupin 2 conserved barrel domain-containing protein n=1 Tax=Gymnopus androsaceus JB14 TaxID=1447944 RepID=A0A6A4I7D6_9AGAR|nr:hypothetical protein BT96DRAFT_875467 [Gymnopus androsaceus JB14]
MTDSADFSDSATIGKGITMFFEDDLKRLVSREGADDEHFFVAPHWHEEHDEIMSILEGKLKITVGSEVRICTPETGDCFIPRRVPHSLEAFKFVPVVFTERTNPSRLSKNKELFFRNLFVTPGALTGSLGFLQTMLVFYHGDLYPTFPIHLAWLEKAFVTFIGGYVAPLLGHRVAYKSLEDVKKLR